MARIVVSGALANKPFNGGEAWVRLNWILGFRKLGFDVHFVEQIDPHTSVDADGAVAPFAESVNLTYFQQVTRQFGLADASTLIYNSGEQFHGLDDTVLLDLAGAADLLVNISGHLTWEPLLCRFRRKVYVDIDPGFVQFWHADPKADFCVGDHDAYFTIGENVGMPGCPIPTADIQWQHIRQPVVLDEWPVVDAGNRERFTTIASWRGAFGPIYYGDAIYGLKVHEFRKFVDLPLCSPQVFEIALQIYPGDHKDLEMLRGHGWRIVEPRNVAVDPMAFRRYVQGSGAEFSVAQGIYVDTNSGWFSDRTVRYLASGKPALVQETGFSRHLPVGEGLLAFRTLDEAIAGAEAIMRDYDRHSRAARRIAEDYFDSDRVLGRFLDDVDLST